MTQQHPITPPPELVQQWIREKDGLELVVTRAAQWGADTELEACCEWLDRDGWSGEARQLRAARRPKLPSLKKQALLAIDTAVADDRLSADVANVVRRALEQLDD